MTPSAYGQTLEGLRRGARVGTAVTLGDPSMPPPLQQPHQAREMAESFGSDPARYDETRPRYPAALVEAVIAGSPGPDVVDVGCGTGIAARQFQAAGCNVLGVEVDARMAEFARQHGVDVEVSRFEAWDPAGREFDAVIAAQTWHWIEPQAGAAKAVEALRPGGRLALFWNVFDPGPKVSEAFAEVYRRVVPDHPFNPWASSPLEAYSRILSKVTEGIRATGGFAEPEQWRFDWSCDYTREQWLAQIPTGGDVSQLEPAKRDELLDALGRAIDGLGGSFTMPYAAIVVTAAAA